MKTGILCSAAVFLCCLFGQCREDGCGYAADDNVLIAELPEMSEVVRRIAEAEADGAVVTEASVRAEESGAEIKIRKGEPGERIVYDSFRLDYVRALDAAVMPKCVYWRMFAGRPYYRVYNGFESVFVDASDTVAVPFVMTEDMLREYFRMRCGGCDSVSVAWTGGAGRHPRMYRVCGGVCVMYADPLTFEVYEDNGFFRKLFRIVKQWTGL